MSQARFQYKAATNPTNSMGTAPAPPLDPPLDLSSCDREPIHLPGSIQPHGFLLALGQDGQVRVASANAGPALGQPTSSLFGRSLPDILGQQAGSLLLAALTAAPLGSASRLLAAIRLAGPRTVKFQVVAFEPASHPGTTVLEFEPIHTHVDTEQVNAQLYNFVARIRTMPALEELCQAAVEEIHALTGCDRVVLYRFDDQGHGLVLAETLAGDRFASYLGLRFPASDVPRQARRMYEVNRVRIIPNLDYEPSPLLAAPGPPEDQQNVAAIDLSSSILRSVSPVHRQYMRNMGTLCSMSISILIDGRLWGLVSCHHHAPRYVPLRQRLACDFTLQIVASQLELQSKGSRVQRALEAKAAQHELIGAMAGQENSVGALASVPELLQTLVHADGVAIVEGDRLHLSGVTPTEAELLPLLVWLRQPAASTALQPAPSQPAPSDEVFVSSRLERQYPPAATFAANASGLLALSFSSVHNTQVLWFRQEQLQIVRWAGNPAKSAEPAPGHATIEPRHSFEEWKETVRGSCEPWTGQEVEAAAEFRTAMLQIVLKHAEELASLAAGLQVANEELEAFSYSVSHDLRAPFRHISDFSDLLQEEESDRLSDRGRHYVSTIQNSARFAGKLVDSLLDFSHFARSKVSLHPIDMAELTDDVWHAVMADEAKNRHIDFSRTELPRVIGDPQLLRQVLRNLLSNAAKYTGKRERARVRVAVTLRDKEFVFSFADNGVGFDQQYAGKLFGVFQRLHRIEDFEGTGIGLANVRRIVGRLGGRVWAEGDLGRGAVFYFTLPRSPVLPREEA